MRCNSIEEIHEYLEELIEEVDYGVMVWIGKNEIGVVYEKRRKKNV